MKPLDVCFRGCLNGANSLVYQTPSSLHIHLDSDLWAALFLSSHRLSGLIIMQEKIDDEADEYVDVHKR